MSDPDDPSLSSVFRSFGSDVRREEIVEARLGPREDGTVKVALRLGKVQVLDAGRLFRERDDRLPIAPCIARFKRDEISHGEAV